MVELLAALLQAGQMEAPCFQLVQPPLPHPFFFGFFSENGPSSEPAEAAAQQHLEQEFQRHRQDQLQRGTLALLPQKKPWQRHWV
mmetsp:Transcript_25679/g.64776  ORF Transcript_25679/g.64776 Transcript_25679/m.64776 type:complete len:85 (-) Transcript_25679:872-1126(-)